MIYVTLNLILFPLFIFKMFGPLTFLSYLLMVLIGLCIILQFKFLYYLDFLECSEYVEHYGLFFESKDRNWVTPMVAWNNPYRFSNMLTYKL